MTGRLSRVLGVKSRFLTLGTVFIVVFSSVVQGGMTTIRIQNKAATPLVRLDEIGARLGDETGGPLAPFRISLGASIGELRQIVSLPSTGRVQARDDIYLHAALTERRAELEGGVLPAPSGLRVLDGDFYFHPEEDGLVQVSLLIEATSTTEHAIDQLEGWLGAAEFEIVLPGSLNLIIGWKTPGGYLMGTFSDLAIFQLSAFPDEPADLLAGSQIVLYEGLANFSRGLADGAPESELLPELERVVRWVESTRSVLEPIN